MLRMELCAAGDVEGYIKMQPAMVLASTQVQSFLLQMAVALYAAHTELRLVHYDIKCLNFFLKTLEPTEGSPHSLRIRYKFGDLVYTLPESTVQVKLADFGTATMPLEADGEIQCGALTPGQFATLENTPLEYYLVADAVQGPQADIYQLGLCFLHMITGEAPYEELLEKICCPAALGLAIQGWWQRESCYEVVCEALDIGRADNKLGTLAQTACDTIYRMVVILGKDGLPESPIAQEILKHLNTVGAKQFKKDQASASLDCGQFPCMRRARQLLDDNPGAEELLKGMLAFCSEIRLDMGNILRSSYFQAIATAATEDKDSVTYLLPISN